MQAQRISSRGDLNPVLLCGRQAHGPIHQGTCLCIEAKFSYLEDLKESGGFMSVVRVSVGGGGEFRGKGYQKRFFCHSFPNWLAGVVVSALASHAGGWGSTPGGVVLRFSTINDTFSKEGTPYAISKLLFKKNECYTLYRCYCLRETNAIRCIEVTVRKNRTLYPVLKLLFENRCCIEATFQSNFAQLCLVV